MTRSGNLLYPLCIILFPGVAACGGGGGPVAFGSYCDEYARITCNAAQRCDCLGGYTVEMCLAVMLPDCRDSVETPVNSGRMSYDAAEAGRCLSGVKSIIGDCSLEGDDYPASCDTMLVGNVPAGQECGEDGECRPGMKCRNDACAAMPGDGQPCLDGSECAGDLYCGQDTQCHSHKGRGENCAEGSRVCGDELYCSGASQTCQPYPGSGRSCVDSYGTCAGELYCDAADRICREPMPAGSLCAGDEQCHSGDCAGGVCAEAAEGDCPFL